MIHGENKSILISQSIKSKFMLDIPNNYVNNVIALLFIDYKHDETYIRCLIIFVILMYFY